MNCIKIEYCPNPDCLVIHTRHRFGQIKVGFDSEDCDVLMNRLTSINGVVGVSTHDYHIQLSKAALFGWPEILAQVLPIISLEVFNGEELEEWK